MFTSRSTSWARVLWRSRRPLVARRVTAIWVALGAFYAVFEQAIRPHDLMRDLEAASPGHRVRVAVVVLMVSTLALRGHARALLYDRALAPAWRAPISRARWAVLLTPYLVLLALPLAIVSVLWPPPRAPHALVFVALAAPMLTAAGGSGARALAWWVATCALGAGALTLSLAPTSALAAWASALALGAASLALTAHLYDDLRGRAGGRGALAFIARLARPRGPHGALLARDLICLWRTERGALVGALVTTLPLAAFVFAVGRHDGPVGTTLAALGALAAPLASLWLVRLRGRLGEHGVTPRRWPILAADRLPTLALVCNLPLALLYALSLAAASGWTLPQLVIAISPLPVFALAPIACTLWTRWWTNAGHMIPFATLGGFFLTRLPAPYALAAGALAGLALTRASRVLLTRAREAHT